MGECRLIHLPESRCTLYRSDMGVGDQISHVAQLSYKLVFEILARTDPYITGYYLFHL